MRSISHTCSSCGQVDRIDRAVLVGCPACLAAAGFPCTDLRSRTYAETARPHAERVEVLESLDRGADREPVAAR